MRTQLPRDSAALIDWLGAAAGLAPLFAALDRAFASDEAVAELPIVTPAGVPAVGARKKSAASRHAGHPFLRAVEVLRCRRPLWRTATCLEECAEPALLAPVRQDDGMAVVPAARGLCAVRANLAEGRVAALTRRTPTNHLTASGGALERALSRMSIGSSALITLVVDILSPCLPVSIREAADA